MVLATAFMIDGRYFRAKRESITGDGIGLYVFERSNGQAFGAQPITLSQVPETHELQPAAVLNPGQAQKLMDDLWDAGVRPTEGAGSAGAMAATQRHLDDLRALVFGLMPGATKPVTPKP